MTSYLEINLAQYKNNLKKILNSLENNTKIMAIVKADGYGLGALSLTKAAYEIGIRHVGVAHLSEALELRDKFKDISILLLSEPPSSDCSELIKHNITSTVYTQDFLSDLQNESQKQDKVTQVHLKIDTGMRRVGSEISESLPLGGYIQTASHLNLEGVYTHFANANLPESNFTAVQLERFKSCLDEFKKNNINPPIIHAANTFATQYFKNAHFNMVRIGLGGVHDILSLKSVVSLIKKVPKNSPIGYEGQFTTTENTHIGIIPLGYADGIPLELSNQGSILIHDKSYPIIGNVCMDMVMVNLGSRHTIKRGDPVTLIGQDKTQAIQLNNYVDITKKQPRYILCGFRKRLKRVYIS